MKKFKAIIFDMDGTIVDTSSVWINTNTLFLLKYKIFSPELAEKLNSLLHGIPPSIKLNEIKKLCKLENIPNKEILATFDKATKQSYKETIQYIKEFEPFVKKLIKHNIPIAIATNSCNHGITIVNNNVDLKKYFKDHIYGIECVNRVAKPKPDIFLYAAKRLEIYPENCIVFEDSIHGVTAAKHSNMFTIAINTMGIRESLIHADMVIDCYSEIILEKYFDL